MTNITILGIDLAKNVFELCGLGADGEVVTVAQSSVKTSCVPLCSWK